MNRRIISLILAFLSFSLFGNAETPHEFTSADGSQKVKATVVAFSDGKFQIKLAGGRLLSVAPERFIEEDQLYLKNWAESNINYSFAVEVERTKNGTRNTTDGGWRLEISKAGYDIEIQSRVAAPLENVEIQYMVFESQHGPKSSRPSEGVIAYVSGVEEVELFKSLGKVEFPTETFELVEGNLLPNYVMPGGRSDFRDRIAGLWIKIFHKGKEVYEFKTNDQTVKEARWKSPTEEKK